MIWFCRRCDPEYESLSRQNQIIALGELQLFRPKARFHTCPNCHFIRLSSALIHSVSATQERSSHARRMPSLSRDQFLRRNLDALPRVETTQTLSRDQIRARIERGILTRLLPGRYISTSALPNHELPLHEYSSQLAKANLSAGLTKLHADESLSHTSAGILWGMPWYGTDARVHTIRPVTRRVPRDQFALHTVRVVPEQIRVVQGFQVTDLEQTALDLASIESPAHGLAILDHARRLGASVHELEDIAKWRKGNGHMRVLRLAQLSVQESDSPRESECRYWIYKAGAREIETQFLVKTQAGNFFADMRVKGTSLLFEYDGMNKYSLSSDALFKEKVREDAIRELGFKVVRVTRHDLAHPDRFMQSVRVKLRSEGYKLARGTEIAVP